MQIVEKAWGREIIFANYGQEKIDYCGKLLVYDKAGAKGSMHFHIRKHETFYVQQGSFCIHYIVTDTAEKLSVTLKVGDIWVNEPGEPHQIESLEDNSILIEASTFHEDTDTYRILPGDSQ